MMIATVIWLGAVSDGEMLMLRRALAPKLCNSPIPSSHLSTPLARYWLMSRGVDLSSEMRMTFGAADAPVVRSIAASNHTMIGVGAVHRRVRDDMNVCHFV
jgi:hypothetical protein